MTDTTNATQHPDHHPHPSTFAPEHVRRISPYLPGKPIEELARESGLDERDIVKLASNENPRGPSPAVRAAITAALDDVCRYPDGNGFALKAGLARHLAVAPEQIVLGNGSNDILELVAHAFLKAGDNAVYSRHAFAVYPLATQARGATGIEVPALKLGHDLPAMLKAITPATRIVFIANPNNPTGTWIAPDVLEKFIAAVPRSALVVLDEAYHDYLEPHRQPPSISWVSRYPNLVVSRTFSKAHGLAGLRVGYGVMNTQVADLLNRVRQPFNVNSLAQVAALAALDDRGYVEESRRLNREGMRALAEGLSAMKIEFVPPYGNFVLVKVGDAARVYQRLLEQGVIVRPVAASALPEHLRVTIGLPAENRRFLDALKVALAA
jgi:histidinol-phosphate aminotransferase